MIDLIITAILTVCIGGPIAWWIYVQVKYENKQYGKE